VLLAPLALEALVGQLSLVVQVELVEQAVIVHLVS
jgi:hypothetical protein